MRFFKVMMPGFHQKLNLPPAVSKELEKCKSETAILESRLGRWKMGLSRNCENDLICFEQGWPQFVDHHAMGIGDFIVFEPSNSNSNTLHHHLHFHVYVFDSSACEKEFRVEADKTTQALDPTTEDEEAPFFKKTMVAHNATKYGQVSIPTDFMRSNNLGNQKSASLRDPRGREWAVNLTVGGSQLRQRMCSGWHDFYTSNALKNGDICVFKLRPQNLTQTTIFFDVEWGTSF